MNLYAYCLNNPVMMIDSTGMAPEWLKDVGRFIGGLAITVISAALTVATLPLLIIPGASIIPQFFMTTTIYGGALMASPFSSTIKSDMQLIGWNPFNSSEAATGQSQKISFYKGVAVFRVNASGSAGIPGMIFFRRGESADWIKHEYGHVQQARVLGALLFFGIIGIPSIISFATDPANHPNRWFERWANIWGGYC